MMTNVTFSIPEGTVRRLRRCAAESGKKKGVLSEMVDEALTSYLDSLEGAKTETFSAVERGETVATARSLRELAEALRARGTDPRKVRIVSSEPVPPVAHFGLRLKPA